MNKKSKKISNFDTPEMFEFISLMINEDITNWNQIDGKIIDYDQLLQRNVINIFENKLLLNRLKKTLVVSEFSHLRIPGQIKHPINLLFFLQDILSRKNYCTYSFSDNAHSVSIFSGMKYRINKK